MYVQHGVVSDHCQSNLQVVDRSAVLSISYSRNAYNSQFTLKIILHSCRFKFYSNFNTLFPVCKYWCDFVFISIVVIRFANKSKLKRQYGATYHKTDLNKKISIGFGIFALLMNV